MELSWECDWHWERRLGKWIVASLNQGCASLRVSTEQFPIETRYGENGTLSLPFGAPNSSLESGCGRAAMWSVYPDEDRGSLVTVACTQRKQAMLKTHWTRVHMHNICAALCAACDSSVARQSQGRTEQDRAPQRTILVALVQANTWPLQNVKANAGHSLACLKKTLSLICSPIPRPNATVVDTGEIILHGQA